jgi:hypothetical protein
LFRNFFVNSSFAFFTKTGSFFLACILNRKFSCMEEKL